jgi:hypothetical protein
MKTRIAIYVSLIFVGCLIIISNIDYRQILQPTPTLIIHTHEPVETPRPFYTYTPIYHEPPNETPRPFYTYTPIMPEPPNETPRPVPTFTAVAY